ncbi:hypothetical protein RJZ90_006050 [Blastomyces dermatitidis]
MGDGQLKMVRGVSTRVSLVDRATLPALSAPIYPGRITGRQLNHVARLCWLYGYLGMLAAKDVGQDRWNLP